MSVYKHQGKYRFDWEMNGQRITGSGYRTKKEAIAAQAESKKNLKSCNTPFKVLCEKALAEIEANCSKSHYQECGMIFDKLKNWESKRQITRLDVEEFINRTAEESKAKANKYLRRIKALFNYGVERDLIEFNPAQKIKPRGIDKKKKYIPPLEDVMKVLDLAKKQDRFYLLLVIHTLARIREINNLKWEDIYDEYLILWTRKTKHANLEPRSIPLNNVLREVIKELPKTGEYVFMNPRKNAVTKQHTKYDYRDKFLKTLCKKADVQDFTFHCLRHFGASLLASSGAGLSDIQGLLGHSQISTTNLYVQSLRSGMIDAVKKMEKIR